MGCLHTNIKDTKDNDSSVKRYVGIRDGLYITLFIEIMNIACQGAQ